MSENLTLRRPARRAADAPSPTGRRAGPGGRRGRSGAPRLGRRTREALLFTGATAIAAAHGLDDAFLGRQPGVGGDHLGAAVVATALALAAVAGFPFLRPGLRAVIALSFGVLALVNGALHVIHIAIDAPAHSDYSGVLAAAAGVVLIALAIVIPFRHRGERPVSPARRWANRLGAGVGGLVLAALVLMPVAVAITQTHKYREPIGAPPTDAFEEVTFRSSDGLDLSGWYAPSRNRAAVIVVHGGGGDRMGARAHARLVARHGYGVLVYDSRGRGRSEGSPNAYGWGWEKDVAGALDFLAKRPDVDAGHVGGLGLSTGADVLIEVAATRRDLRAVVAEGATGRSWGDFRSLPEGGPEGPFLWVGLNATRVLSGSSPGPPLEQLVARVAPTPLLLIAAGRFPGERDFNLVYAGAAREPFEFWDIRDGHHTAAIRERPAEYRRRAIGLFDRALLPGT